MIFGVCHSRDRKPISHCRFCGEANAAPFGLYEIDAEINELTGDFVKHGDPLCNQCRKIILESARATKDRFGECKERQ